MVLLILIVPVAMGVFLLLMGRLEALLLPATPATEERAEDGARGERRDGPTSP